MAFNKEEYWKNRKKGLRGQGEKVRPSHLRAYLLGTPSNRASDRREARQDRHEKQLQLRHYRAMNKKLKAAKGVM